MPPPLVFAPPPTCCAGLKSERNAVNIDSLILAMMQRPMKRECWTRQTWPLQDGL